MIGATPSYTSGYYAQRMAPTGGAVPVAQATVIPQAATVTAQTSGEIMYNNAGQLFEAIKSVWSFLKEKAGPMLANAFASARTMVQR